MWNFLIKLLLSIVLLKTSEMFEKNNCPLNNWIIFSRLFSLLSSTSDEMSSIRVTHCLPLSINALDRASPNIILNIFSSPREKISDIGLSSKDKIISALWGPLVEVRREQSSLKYCSNSNTSLELSNPLNS